MRSRRVTLVFVFGDLLSVACTLLPPVFSAGLCVIAVTALARYFAVSHGVVFALAPVLYLCWLIVFLFVSSLEMRTLGLVYSKPERPLDGTRDLRSAISGIVLNHIYRREILVRSLPMFDTLLHPPILLRWLRWLGMHAYAPSVHIGKDSNVFAWLQDPDLTHIGDSVVIGNAADVVCHVLNQRNGSSVYQAVRVHIGSSVTIGGNSRIGMGVHIDDGAVVEVGSNVLPFSRIGPGEVWGGSPAVFLRMVETSGSHKPSSTAGRSGGDRAALEAIVARALNLPPTEVAEVNVDNCAAWDSLGKMSIAASLYDQFGIRIAAADVARLDSVSSIERLIAQQAVPEQDAVDSSRAAVSDLYADPELLPLFDPQDVTRALAGRTLGADTKPPRKIAVSATFTAQPLAAPVELWCRAFDVPVAMEFQDFNQLEQALLSPESVFGSNDGGLNLVLVRPEDLISERDPDGMVRARQLLAAMDEFRSRGGSLVVSSLPPVVSSFAAGDQAATDRLRRSWIDELRQRDGLRILDFSAIVEDLGRENARDTSAEIVARSPYSPALFQRLAVAVTRLVRASFLPPKKVLALDCDNLLWGGVIGEDGIDGIQLDDEYPGRSFRMLQRSILELKSRGVVIVLVSKNEEADVWHVFDAHPGMVLRRRDIAAARINWQPKSANLREIAAELNLGLDSFVLLDDSALERHEVQANAGEVTVVPLPEDPTRFVEVLGRLWCFDSVGVTAEDATRTELVSAEAKRQSLREQTGGLEAFLASLELAVEVRPPSERELPRVAQLTQKTNQFNLSLRRRTLPEVQRAHADGSVLILAARDRLGDYGLVGVAVFERSGDRLLVDTFLMSCRALGRGVEDALLAAVFEAARGAGCAIVAAKVCEGPRNQQTREFFLRAGFILSNGTLSLPVSKAPPPPQHLRLSLAIDNRLPEMP